MMRRKSFFFAVLVLLLGGLRVVFAGDGRDVVFVLDERSGSEGARRAVERSVEEIAAVSAARTRTGLVVFGSVITDSISLRALGDTGSNRTMDDALDAWRDSGAQKRLGNGNPSIGIDRAIEELRADGRKDAAREMVVVSGGEFNTGSAGTDGKFEQWLVEVLAKDVADEGIRVTWLGAEAAPSGNAIARFLASVQGQYVHLEDGAGIPPAGVGRISTDDGEAEVPIAATQATGAVSMSERDARPNVAARAATRDSDRVIAPVDGAIPEDGEDHAAGAATTVSRMSEGEQLVAEAIILGGHQTLPKEQDADQKQVGTGASELLDPGPAGEPGTMAREDVSVRRLIPMDDRPAQREYATESPEGFGNLGILLGLGALSAGVLLIFGWFKRRSSPPVGERKSQQVDGYSEVGDEDGKARRREHGVLNPPTARKTAGLTLAEMADESVLAALASDLKEETGGVVVPMRTVVLENSFREEETHPDTVVAFQVEQGSRVNDPTVDGDRNADAMERGFAGTAVAAAPLVAVDQAREEGSPHMEAAAVVPSWASAEQYSWDHRDRQELRTFDEPAEDNEQGLTEFFFESDTQTRRELAMDPGHGPSEAEAVSGDFEWLGPVRDADVADDNGVRVDEEVESERIPVAAFDVTGDYQVSPIALSSEDDVGAEFVFASGPDVLADRRVGANLETLASEPAEEDDTTEMVPLLDLNQKGKR